MTTYGDLTDVLSEIGTLLEEDYTLPSGRIVRIRELSAAARIEASQAGQAGGKFDATLFNAIVVQSGTVKPPIPKTDIPKLMAGRGGVLAEWANAIWGLSEATPDAFKSGDRAVDAAEQDAGDSAPDS
jgi:hypothetical protein